MKSRGQQLLLAEIEKRGLNLAKIEALYPKLCEPLLPISITGVSARTFAHWKKEGLIDLPGASTRSWTRLNLFQFLWLKIIQVMREFGAPFESIRETKSFLFAHHIEKIVTELEDYRKFLKTESNYSEERIENEIEMIKESAKMLKGIPEDRQILSTIIGSLVGRTLLLNDQSVLALARSGAKFRPFMFTYQTIDEFREIALKELSAPHLQIPLQALIESFFNEPANDRLAESFGLLNNNEKRVLEAFRKNDFKELIIKMSDGSQTLTIEKIRDGDLRDEKAREIRKILGLNQYDEVTLKLRNDKNIYFKNKSRM
jgi:DNA-binding transcriptional MerR regulator